jgi:hypothetical protein
MSPIIEQFVVEHDIKEEDGELQMTTAQKTQLGTLFSQHQRDTADVWHRGMLVCHIDRNKPSDSYDATLGANVLFRDQSSKKEMKHILDMSLSTSKRVSTDRVRALKDARFDDRFICRRCFEQGHTTRSCPNEEAPFPQDEIDGGDRLPPRLKGCSSRMKTKVDEEQKEKQEDENDEEEEQDEEENAVESGEAPYVGADIQVQYDEKGAKKWYKAKITSRERGVDKWRVEWVTGGEETITIARGDEDVRIVSAKKQKRLSDEHDAARMTGRTRRGTERLPNPSNRMGGVGGSGN